MIFPVTEHFAKTDRHTSFYLSCGAEDAPLIVFVHGWPELSHSWRHQLRCFADLGFRAVAPDMRGYGRSTVHRTFEAYTMEAIVGDMIELLDALGRESAVWVGHDWGAPVVWSVVQHHAARVDGVANLCVPYLPNGFAVQTLIPLVDRKVYPVEQYPVGQWDYHLYYEESFDAAGAAFEADPQATVKALFRKGHPGSRGKPAATASVRRQGGWFGKAGRAPDLPRDPVILAEDDLRHYVDALTANGFFGPDAWYMNAGANVDYATRAPNGGRIARPALFFHGLYDAICETIDSPLAGPMRAFCDDLTELTVPSGHWMAQERPELVNAGIARWLAQKLPTRWRV